MNTPIHQIPVRRITGEDTNLGEYSGKVLLIVNVASKCGLTKQYESLEKLYRDYRDRGLVVAGFPANDFKGQEPGSNDEIQNFCTSNFGVDFPLFEKITVVDPASSFHLTGSNRKPGLRLMNTRLPNRYRLSWAMKGRRALQCQKRREVLKSETKYRSSFSFRISSERTLVQYFAVTAPRYSKSIHWEMTMSSLQPFLRRHICSDSQAHSLADLLLPQSSLANGYRCQRRQIAPISSGKG